MTEFDHNAYDPPSGRLQALGLRHGTDKATHHGYCDFYEHHLPDTITRLLEIGIMDGASLRMWADYYPRALIDGMDIELRPTAVRDRPVNVAYWHRDATKINDLLDLPMYDVIIDDGSHMTADQLASLELLWTKLRPGGCYVIEDLHTSLIPSYVNSPISTLDYLLSDHDLPPGADEPIIWRNPDQPTESITAIIRKIEFDEDADLAAMSGYETGLRRDDAWATDAEHFAADLNTEVD